ncbi:MAG TPA: hypothetical protein VNT31_05480 [Nocardioides sp.]|nr:hypothetical protein [Nocardioides sp.]
MRRTCLRAVPGALLLLPLAACGDSDPAAAASGPLGNGVVWADGSEIHFPGGEVVDSGQDEPMALSRTSHGVVSSDWDAGTVHVTPDGAVTDLGLPDAVRVATDPGQPMVAWMTYEPFDGVLHVLDATTGTEQAAIRTDLEHDLEISLDGDTAWLHSGGSATTLRVDWRRGKVTKAPASFVRDVRGHHATVEGGNENFVEAGVAKPGIVDLRTRRMIRRGWDWAFSPLGTYAVGIFGEDGDSTTKNEEIGVLDLASGRLTRFPIVLGEGGWTEWAWTPDDTSIYWFEGTELVVCEVATSDCKRDAVDADQPQVA